MTESFQRRPRRSFFATSAITDLPNNPVGKTPVPLLRRIPFVRREQSHGSVEKVPEAAQIGESPLHAATRLFINASKQYPSSVLSQGAAIAQQCQKDSLNPLELRDALLGNDERLEKIAGVATSMHRQHLSQHSDSQVPAKDIKIGEVAYIVEYDFNWAYDLMVLEPSQLQMMLDAYQTRTSEYSGTLNTSLAVRMIMQRRRLLGLSDKDHPILTPFALFTI